jgi:hypothetical protein
MESSLESLDYCSQFIDLNINNKKGVTFETRFIDILSDPNNIFIKRCEQAGTTVNECVILHNGIKVQKYGYYGNFSEILTLNKGCHEPAEERMFELILNDIPENGTMIELGSYWAFYTIWFNNVVKNAKNYCIEPDLNNLEIGKKNCLLNNVNNVNFVQGFIGKNQINLYDFVLEKNIEQIDILHSDVQGYELEMLQDITELLIQNKIKYLFISTHSDYLHYECINLLKRCNYRIIASADYETETFCFDGIIVACHISNKTFGNYNIGNRKFTKLIVPIKQTN